MSVTKVAAKILRNSDLTLFRAQFAQLQGVSKQKAINLNRDVFIDRFYPGLRDHVGKLKLHLEIRGPAGKPALSGTATALQQQKNWRLDGRLIEDPPDDAGRFLALAEGDIAILAFEGANKPESVTLLLLSATHDADSHSLIQHHCDFTKSRDSMRVLAHSALVALAAAPAGSCLLPLVTPDSVEDAMYGAATPLLPAGRGRGIAISPETVKTQVDAASVTGQLGEEAFELWLIHTEHAEADYEWVSKRHARAVYDFEVLHPKWDGADKLARVDVKSTRGDHATDFHMSFAEVRWAAEDASYRIARVSALDESCAHVAILTGVHELCRTLISSLTDVLPEDVAIDSLRIGPGQLPIEFESRVDW